MPNDEQQPQPADAPTLAPVALPLGQQTATDLEERPVTAAPHDDPGAGNGQPLAQAFIVQPKSHKKLFVTLGSVVGVLVVGALLFGTYYYFIRLQDSEYQAALGPIDAMLQDVDKTKSLSNQTTNATTTSFRVTASPSPSPSPEDAMAKIGQKAAEARKNTNDYADQLKQLKALPVVTKDITVSRAFTSSQAAFESYLAKEGIILDSLDIFQNVLTKYVGFSDKLGTVKSVADYDAATDDVTNYLNQHQTVPQSDFNKAFYVPYRKDILDLLSVLHDYLDAIETKNKTELTSSMTEMTVIVDRLQTLGDAAKKYKPITAGDPSSQLSDLKQTINNRKAIFLR